jgi:SAM-dependent methyltransferase
METALRPELFAQTLFAYLRTGVLRAAVDLELFTHVARGKQTAAEIAGAAGADERAVRIVLDAITGYGLVTKTGGRYGLSPLAELLLVKGAPMYAGDFTRIAANPRLWEAVGRLTEVVRTGVPPESVVDVPAHEFWVEFGEASYGASQLPATTLAGLLDLDPAAPAEVLDVACGSGAYGFALLARFPLARLTSLDWENVLGVARGFAERRGVAERVTWLPGSAFETPLPAARYDAVIASHFYHHFSPAENVRLSRRLFEALTPGGRLAIHEWVPDEARATDEAALSFAVVMLATTRAGDVYTFDEYRGMLEAAGFRDATAHEVPGIGSQILVARTPAGGGGRARPGPRRREPGRFPAAGSVRRRDGGSATRRAAGTPSDRRR